MKSEADSGRQARKPSVDRSIYTVRQTGRPSGRKVRKERDPHREAAVLTEKGYKLTRRDRLTTAVQV